MMYFVCTMMSCILHFILLNKNAWISKNYSILFRWCQLFIAFWKEKYGWYGVDSLCFFCLLTCGIVTFSHKMVFLFVTWVSTQHWIKSICYLSLFLKCYFDSQLMTPWFGYHIEGSKVTNLLIDLYFLNRFPFAYHMSEFLN